jgi:queuine tRNA-ribosyltransferase
MAGSRCRRYQAPLDPGLRGSYNIFSMSLKFEIFHQDSGCQARTGRISTRHGSFETPAFMAVGTRGSVKGLTPQMLGAAGCEILLGNTYHLMLRPGAETVAALGGLQKFTGWHRPMLTDSGGFQVFSLSELRSFDDTGVNFRSHIDGSMVHLGPLESMRVQHLLGADIAMAFDDCPPADCPGQRLAEAMARTLVWAKTSQQVHESLDVAQGQALFAIVQGGTDPQARQHCAQELVGLKFDGYAIGGLAVGEGHARMVQAIDHTVAFLPYDRPRYLMGVGYPRDILQAVKRGVDMFDCVLPTRNGRNALAFTRNGPLRLRNAQYIRDTRPIEAECDGYCCQNFSRGYIRHLFSVGEMLGPTLVSLHNVHFFQRWMLDIRRAIRDNALSGLRAWDSDLSDAAP